MELINKLRYYTLSREVYTRCVLADYMNSLRLMIVAGTIYFAICVYAFITFRLSEAIVASLLQSLIIIGLGGASVIYSIACLGRYRQYRNNGKAANPKYVFAAMISAYIVILLSTISYQLWVAPWGIPAVFVAFLGGGLLLLPPYFFVSMFIKLAMFTVYVVLSIIMVVPECCWVCQLSDAAFGVAISLALMWYVNMHKLVATNNTILMRNERDNYAQKSITDDLTGLPNYRDFMQRLERCLTQYRKTDLYMCLAVMDIDHFKDYNDYYGHPQGDECLRLIGEALRMPWENTDIYAARIGGEEFALLWFDKDIDSVKEIAQEARRRINDMQIPHIKSNVAPYVTFSIGVDVSPSGKYDNTRSAYTAADSALYTAKENGRNNVVIVFDGGQFESL